jgi:hypothetical protein
MPQFHPAATNVDENCGEKWPDCEAGARQCPQKAGSATLILDAREGTVGITADNKGYRRQLVYPLLERSGHSLLNIQRQPTQSTH